VTARRYLVNRNRQENDPSRDRSSRVDRVVDDLGGENTDLGRRQSEGNLGNERTRNRDDEGNPSDRSRDREDLVDRDEI
jgi:hypothetical protein